MSSLHSKARAISYLGLSSTDLPGDLAISWTLSIIDWQVRIPNNLFYNNAVCACKAVEWGSVFSPREASGGGGWEQGSRLRRTWVETVICQACVFGEGLLCPSSIPSYFYNEWYELMCAEDMASRAQKTVVNINIRLIVTDLNHQLEFIARKVWRFAWSRHQSPQHKEILL